MSFSDVESHSFLLEYRTCSHIVWRNAYVHLQEIAGKSNKLVLGLGVIRCLSSLTFMRYGLMPFDNIKTDTSCPCYFQCEVDTDTEESLINFTARHWTRHQWPWDDVQPHLSPPYREIDLAATSLSIWRWEEKVSKTWGRVQKGVVWKSLVGEDAVRNATLGNTLVCNPSSLSRLQLPLGYEQCRMEI
jgi:hypothetical protein